MRPGSLLLMSTDTKNYPDDPVTSFIDNMMYDNFLPQPLVVRVIQHAAPCCPVQCAVRSCDWQSLINVLYSGMPVTYGAHSP